MIGNCIGDIFMVYKNLSFSNKIENLHFQEMQVSICPKGLLIQLADSQYNYEHYNLSDLVITRFAISYKNLDKYLFTGYNLNTSLQLLENCFKTQNLDLDYLQQASEVYNVIKISLQDKTKPISIKINNVDYSDRFDGIENLRGGKIKNAIRTIFGEVDDETNVSPENANLKSSYNLYKNLGLFEKEDEIINNKALEK